MASTSSEADFSIAELVEMLQESDEHVRLFAAVRLEALGTEASPAVPGLAVLLESEALLDRRMAAWVLGSIGPRAKAAVPALLDALHDADAKVRKYASAAIQKIDPKNSNLRAACMTRRLRLALPDEGGTQHDLQKVDGLVAMPFMRTPR